MVFRCFVHSGIAHCEGSVCKHKLDSAAACQSTCEYAWPEVNGGGEKQGGTTIITSKHGQLRDTKCRHSELLQRALSHVFIFVQAACLVYLTD